LKVSEWADKYRKLSPESSAEPGQWDTNRAPFQREIMDTYNDPSVKETWVKKSAQVGWTEILNNVIGYIVAQEPGPTILVQPTKEMAEAWSKDRLAPMLRDSPALHNKVKTQQRSSGNTMLHKTFPGGHITMAGSNSPSSLASRPIRNALFDEVDRFPPSAGEEGDPVNLTKKRTTTFWNRTIFGGSTPTVKGASRIDLAYESGDQRKYYVPCPHCGHMQTLKWSQDTVIFDKHNPLITAYYRCESCAGEIHDRHLLPMLRKGQWRASKPFNGVASFHINELYSPWVTFGEMARNFIDAKRGGRETLKTWINTALGECWEERGERPAWESIKARAEPYQLMTVPSGGLLLTAGVDTQNDRLAVSVVAWGKGSESWRVYYTELMGDPNQQQVWDQLTRVLEYPYEHATGVKMRIVSACIDSGGHRTQAVYNYIRGKGPQVIAIKGMSTPGKPPLGRPSRVDVAWNGQTVPNGIELWPLGVDTIKAVVYGFLKNTEHGPGFFHTPLGLVDEYYKQLTAEELITKTKAGVPYQVWNATGRNEALDCEVYAYAAAVRAGLDTMNWDDLQAKVSTKARHLQEPASVPSPGKRKRKGTLSQVKL
jgi:phage terminase large subunit GpA-like protein